MEVCVLLRRYVCGALFVCGLGWGVVGCRSDVGSADRPPASQTDARPTPPVLVLPEGFVGASGADLRKRDAGAADPDGPRLADAEVEVRMARPIEESIYDPTLTKRQKVDLLLRHYNRLGLWNPPIDELRHHVMSEGMTDLEAAI
jgi:hypothetical protein